MSTNEPIGSLPPFPFSECAFHGFHGAKGHYKELFLRIGLPYAIYYLVISLGSFMFMGEYFSALGAIVNTSGEPDLSELFGFLGKFLLPMLILAPLGLILWASVQNAILRWYMTGDLRGQFGALRFGMDEWRTLGVSLVYGLLVVAVPYIILLVSVLLVAISPILGIITFVVILGIFPVMIYFGIKLSLGVPLSLERRQFTLFDSMRLTKKRGWALLGTYLILGAIYFVIASIVGTIGQLVIMGSIMPILLDPQAIEGDPSQMFEIMSDAFSSPGTLIGLGIYAVLQTLIAIGSMFAFSGLSVYAMRFLQEEKGDIVGNLDVFD
jgi:hypothetical protein